MDNLGLALCSLRRIAFDPADWADVDVDACYATRTLPFDQVEDIIFLATTYYLSNPVRDFWESKYEGTVVWMVAPFAEIEERLETFAEARKEKP